MKTHVKDLVEACLIVSIITLSMFLLAVVFGVITFGFYILISKLFGG